IAGRGVDDAEDFCRRDLLSKRLVTFGFEFVALSPRLGELPFKITDDLSEIGRCALRRRSHFATSSGLLPRRIIPGSLIAPQDHVSNLAASSPPVVTGLRTSASGKPCPTHRLWRTTEIGASFPFPLTPAEVGYLNGHRPFNLGGGNGSKCPIAAIPVTGPSLIRRPRSTAWLGARR